MKLKNILYYLAIIVFITTQLYAINGNTNPEVTNVAFSISGTTVTVTYDVTDAEQSIVTIIMQVSSDGGSTWDFDFGSATGAVGAGVPTGTGKTINWTYSGSYNPNFKIRIFANDETAGGSTCNVATVAYDGKTYNTVQIGDQCWLKENLNIGTMMNSANGGTNNDGNQTNNGIIEKYCYNNNTANCDEYGGLYQWEEAMQYASTEGAQGICPEGWHLPTKAEFETLISEVNGNGYLLLALGEGGSGTNTSGLTVLLAGRRGIDGTTSLGNAILWSSLPDPHPYNYGIQLLSWTSGIAAGWYDQKLGVSIRCIKN